MPETETESAPIRNLLVAGSEVTLLGTAHISRRSAEDVRDALDAGNYDAVAVELCEPRYEQLTERQQWRHLDLGQVIRSGRAGMVAAQLVLSAYQKRLAERLGIEPGAEMRAAIDAAEREGLPLWLVDRNVGITLKRVIRAVPWYQRAMFLTGLLMTFLTRSEVQERDIERLKEGDVLESTFTEFAEQSPRLYEAIIAERDRYMAARLRQYIARHRPGRVLAVVGAGHLKGLAERLGDAPSSGVDAAAECERLERIPPPGRIGRILPWVVVALILSGFGLGFARGPELGWEVVSTWVLINGTMTALGAALARGHPLTIAAAFLAAPLTSLNPTVGAGMVVAAVQTAVSPPHMRDFDTLREQITRLRGWWRNRVARILLVFVFATIGSAAATYIAGFRILELLLR